MLLSLHQKEYIKTVIMLSRKSVGAAPGETGTISNTKESASVMLAAKHDAGAAAATATATATAAALAVDAPALRFTFTSGKDRLQVLDDLFTQLNELLILPPFTNDVPLQPEIKSHCPQRMKFKWQGLKAHKSFSFIHVNLNIYRAFLIICSLKELLLVFLQNKIQTTPLNGIIPLSCIQSCPILCRWNFSREMQLCSQV